MSASDSELESAAEDSLEAALNANGVKRWRNRSREVEYADPKASIDTLLKLRGLRSARRGISVGKIDRPT